MMTAADLAAPRADRPMPRDPRLIARWLAVPTLIGLVVMLFVVNLTLGAYAIDTRAVLAGLAVMTGLLSPDIADPQAVAVLSGIRVPRALLAALAGGGLALSGAVLQGLFRNPLADPGVIGVSSGAALGAALAIVAMAALPAPWRDALSAYALPLGAFVFALVTTLVVYRFGRSEGGPSVASMLLAGIAFNALAFAGVGFLSFMATDEQLRNLIFWNLGSVGGATWPKLAVCAAIGLPAGAWLLRLAGPLDALALGFDEARHLGVDVKHLQRVVVLLAALVVGSLVAFTGVIGFLGLVAPHIVRLSIGPGHRALLPCAALLGAALLLCADLGARTLVAPAEMPVGIVTTAAGAPFFLALLLRTRRGGGA